MCYYSENFVSCEIKGEHYGNEYEEPSNYENYNDQNQYLPLNYVNVTGTGSDNGNHSGLSANNERLPLPYHIG